MAKKDKYKDKVEDFEEIKEAPPKQTNEQKLSALNRKIGILKDELYDLKIERLKLHDKLKIKN